MATTRLMTTVLPYSIDPATDFHVSLFFSHRLEGGGKLSDYPAVQNWPAALRGATIRLFADGTVPIGCTAKLQATSESAWNTAFPMDTKVKDYPQPTVADAEWKSFPANRMPDHAIDAHHTAVCSCPVSRPHALNSPLARAVLDEFKTIEGLRPLIESMQEYPEKRVEDIREVYAARDLATRAALAPVHPAPSQDTGDPSLADQIPVAPDDVNPTDPQRKSPVRALLDEQNVDGRVTTHLNRLPDGAGTSTQRMLRDTHVTARYYHRPEEQRKPEQKPTDGVHEPRTPHDPPDFHERVASASNVPVLARALGLVVDVTVDPADLPKLAQATTIRCEVTVDGTELFAAPVTRCTVDGQRFLALAENPERWNAGRLKVGDTAHFKVVDLDPDAAGLALEQLLRSAIRALAIDANGDRGSFAPAGLRSTGFAIAQIDRPAQLKPQLMKSEGVQRRAGVAPAAAEEFFFEDLLRGLRVEVWDDVTDRWHSLHERRVTAAFGDKVILSGARDTGYLQNPPMNRVPGDPDNPYYVHEVLAGWDGWSLSAPRPGKMIIHNHSGHEKPGEERVVETPESTEEPGLGVRSTVEPGSLPALRYGRSYSFRLAGVDLAGNSVPMDQTPPAAVATLIDSATAHLENLRTEAVERDRHSVAASLREQGTLRPEVSDDRNDRQAHVVRAMASVVDHASVTRVHPELDVAPGEFAALFGAAGDATAVSVPRKFLRWDPITAPTLVPRAGYTTGESLQRMVIRTGLSGGPGLCQRHVVPPKGSELEAEQDGRLDELMRTGNRARAYAIALKERGSLFYTDIQDLNNPGGTVRQPGMALLHTPHATELKTLPQIQDPEVQPAEGQYIVHDVDQLVVPYLPDPMAAGFSLVFYEAGVDHRFADPRVLQSVSVSYTGAWPELQPFRLVLHSAPRLEARQRGNVIDIGLPAGEQVGVRLSTTLDDEHLKKMGLWVINPVNDPNVPAADREVLANAARDGWLWWLTPDEDLRLVHATTRPATPPRISRLSARPRTPNTAAVNLDGVIDVHGASTDKVELRAQWTDPVDDPAKDAPTEKVTAEVVVDHRLEEYERYSLINLDLRAEFVGSRMSEVPIWTAMHRLPDTKARTVNYRLFGTSRYREFFDPDQLPSADDPQSFGNEVGVNIPSSAVPAPPVVHDVIPMFMWEETTEPEHPFAVRRVRRSGVRIWLDRPWYSSGAGEMLAVIATGDPNLIKGRAESVSLWARDPILLGPKMANPYEVPVLSAWQQRAAQLRLAPESLPGRPRLHVEKTGPIMADDKDKVVNAYAFDPEFHRGRKRWFVDVVLESREVAWPFLRLAVARYQPNSLPKLEFSEVVATDFVQLPPERIGSLSRPDADHVRITVSGVTAVTNAPDVELPDQAPTPDALKELLLKSRRVVATLQSRSKTSGSDLDWASGPEVLCELAAADPTTFAATWTAELSLLAPEQLATPGTSDDLRVQIEEFENLSADETPGTPGHTETRRLVYADHFYL